MNTPTFVQLIIVALGFGVVGVYVYICSRYLRSAEQNS
ncbi:MAG: hypothetical protein RJA22_1393 [Verrucomicrobiota bacterium]|jgi:hypothetical protein